jgi:hypothetical protein
MIRARLVEAAMPIEDQDTLGNAVIADMRETPGDKTFDLVFAASAEGAAQLRTPNPGTRDAQDRPRRHGT